MRYAVARLTPSSRWTSAAFSRRSSPLAASSIAMSPSSIRAMISSRVTPRGATVPTSSSFHRHARDVAVSTLLAPEKHAIAVVRGHTGFRQQQQRQTVRPHWSSRAMSSRNSYVLTWPFWFFYTDQDSAARDECSELPGLVDTNSDGHRSSGAPPLFVWALRGFWSAIAALPPSA